MQKKMIEKALSLLSATSEFLTAVFLLIIALGFTLRDESSDGIEFFHIRFEEFDRIGRVNFHVVFIAPLIIMSASVLFRCLEQYCANSVSRLARILAELGAVTAILSIFFTVVFFRIEAMSFTALSYILLALSKFSEVEAGTPERSYLSTISNYFSKNLSLVVTGILLVISLSVTSLTGVSIKVEDGNISQVASDVANLLDRQEYARMNLNECFRDYVDVKQRVLSYTTVVTQKFDTDCATHKAILKMIEMPAVDGPNILDKDLRIGELVIPAGSDFDIYIVQAIVNILASTNENFSREVQRIKHFEVEADLNEALCANSTDGARFCLTRVE
ncbi:hypothetical protein LCM08_13055 [Salipiger pacificus]|nr:hypothetical protein [Alloyangia pacifica]